MRKVLFTLFVAFLITNAMGQATLPFSFDGGNPSGTTTGLTSSNLGSPDYSTSPKMKFSLTGSTLVLYISEAPGILSYKIKWNQSTNAARFPGTFELLESDDNITYTTVQTYNSTLGQPLPNGVVVDETISNLKATTRYLKWIYSAKTNGNIALGAINLAKSQATTPTINISKASISGFSYTLGNGPTAEQSFLVSGSGLTEGIVINPPANYEISTQSGALFTPQSQITLNQSAGAVQETAIYVRLKAGLTANTYNETLNVNSYGAITQSVSLSGSVTAAGIPTINISNASLTGFSYTLGNGPSSEQSFLVSGSDLTGSIAVNPPANYEISTQGGALFTPQSQISLNQSAGAVQETAIYVRLKAGLSANTYNESLTISSAGVSSNSVILSGTVSEITSSTHVLMNVTVPVGTNECWIVGNFSNWSLTNARKLNKIDDTHYSITLDEASFLNGVTKSTMQYKYLSGTGDWMYIEKGSMGEEINDRYYSANDVVERWATIYIPASTSPTISLLATSLSGFNYTEGSGPSAEKSFTVSGANLTQNIAISAPENFEISTTTGVSFIPQAQIVLSPTSGTVVSTTIYLRLKAGLTANTYNETLNVNSYGAITQSVSLSGSVTAAGIPTINISNASLTGFSYTLGNGPTAEQSLLLSGSGLTEGIVIYPPTNYEISTQSGALFTPQSQISLNQSAGAVQETAIYVRLKAGLSVNAYDESITISSAGAASKSVSLSGSVYILSPIKTIHVPTAGTLISLLSNEERGIIIHLTVTGNINWAEIATIKQDIPTLSHLDLSGANVADNTIPGNQFINNSSLILEALILPSSLTSIGISAFRNCTGLKSVVIGNSVTSIGNSAFDGCSGLTGITIGNAVTSIGSSAFRNCTKLMEVVVPNSVTIINTSAFYGCSGINKLTLGTSVATIGTAAFRNSVNLKSIVCLGNNPSTLGDGAFHFEILSTANVIVPTSKLSTYKEHAGWSQFSNIFEPGIYTSTPTINGLIYAPNAGPSEIKSFTIGGAFLSGDINISLSASSDFEISTKTGAEFVPTNSITVSPLDGMVANTTFYVRLKAGLSINTYTENIALETAGFTSRNIALHGAVRSTPETIHVPTAGTLSSLLTTTEKETITKLTITGNIDARDFVCMRDEMTVLADLNLKDANIKAYNSYPANEMPEYSFGIIDYWQAKISLKSIHLPTSTASIGKGVFQNCYNLKKIIILNQLPPTMPKWEKGFDGIVLNALYVPIGSVPVYKASESWNILDNMSFNPVITNIVEYKLKPTTQEATAIKLTSAKLTGSLDVITDSPVSAHGFCWNTTGEPTISDSKLDNGATTTEGAYSNTIDNLNGATTYYVRAFAADGTSGTVYGEEISFSTAEIPATSSLSGNFYNSQYWPKSKSPYTITGNVNLAEGTTLTIEPGVVVNFAGAYEILVMGSIIAEGTNENPITTNNGRVMFRKTNLKTSSLIHFNSNGTKIQLANESEFPHDSPTNSDTLKIFNSTFANSQIVTKGYQTNAAIKFINSEFNGATVTGTYPRSEPAYFENCKIFNSTIVSEPYNYGMYITNCIVKKSTLLTDGCGGHLDVINSSVLNSTFGAGNRGCSGEGSLLLRKSKVVNTSISGIATVNVTDCIIITDSTQTLNLNGTITKSQFIGNSNKLGGVGLDAVTGTITNSTIVNHRIGLQTSALTINNSNLINNSQFAIKNTGATNIDANSNYWGVGNTTTATIREKIWDYYKDMNLGRVSYTNFLTTPNTDAPISPPQNFRKSVAANGVNYSWNANPETDIKGYKLYYGAFDGFTFANVIDLGNVTSYNLATASINDTVLVTAYDLQADGKDDMLQGHESWYSEDVIMPAKPGSISGLTTVCQGKTSVSYSVPVIANANSYRWTLPTGATGVSTTRTITVDYSLAAVSGRISVRGVNEYGEGDSTFVAVVVNALPDKAGPITGAEMVCQGEKSVVYKTASIPGATSYRWTLPEGVTGVSNADTIKVDFSRTAMTDTIRVNGVNDCGLGVDTFIVVTVKPLPVISGGIVGSNNVCVGNQAVVYKVSTATNAISYNWILPNGTMGVSNVDSIAVDFAANAVSGDIKVVAINDCGVSDTVKLAITVKPLIGSIGTITGENTVCAGSRAVVYSIPTVDNATKYIWTLPNGITGVSTTKSITVDFANNASSGKIWVRAENDCNATDSVSIDIIVKPLVGTIGEITGTTTLCAGEKAVTYTVTAVDNALSYEWTLPTGATGTSTTNSITVDYSNTAVSGNITVRAKNDCNETALATLVVTVKPLVGAIGTITGESTVCAGSKAVVYSIPTVDNATKYIWTLPNGVTGSSTTKSISVDFANNATSGKIWVRAENDCNATDSVSIDITVKPLIGTIGEITGTTTLCAGEKAVTYTVTAVDNALSYEWTLPTGATGTSTTNSITVDYNATSESGNITVKAKNDCGETQTATLAVTVKALIGSIGTITGETTICAGEMSKTYSVPAVDNALSYEWTLPTGATGTSTTNSITVDYNATSESGNITVKAKNDCGETQTATLAVTVKALIGSIGTITGETTICAGEMSKTYSVPAVVNALSYEWTLPTGATGTSTSNSIIVDYANTAVSGNITVKAKNDCGETQTATLAVTVNEKPTTPIITITDNTLKSNMIEGNQWYNEEGLIVGAIDQEYIPTVNGEYYVIVSKNGCSSELSNKIRVDKTSTNYISDNGLIKIYPNPVRNEMHLEYDGETSFEIVNLIGQVIYKGSLLKSTIVETSQLFPGVYLVKFSKDNVVYTQKFIKD